MEIFISLVVAIGILITSAFFSDYKLGKKEKEMQTMKQELTTKDQRLSKAESESHRIKKQLVEANEVIVLLAGKEDTAGMRKEIPEDKARTEIPDTIKSGTIHSKQKMDLESQKDKTKYEGGDFSGNLLGKTQTEGSEIYYTIKVGDFNNLEKADAFAYRLKGKGYSVRVIYEKSAPPPFKVYVGKFKSLKNAEQSASILNTKEGLTTVIKPVH